MKTENNYHFISTLMGVEQVEYNLVNVLAVNICDGHSGNLQGVHCIRFGSLVLDCIS